MSLPSESPPSGIGTPFVPRELAHLQNINDPVPTGLLQSRKRSNPGTGTLEHMTSNSKRSCSAGASLAFQQINSGSSHDALNTRAEDTRDNHIDGDEISTAEYYSEDASSIQRHVSTPHPDLRFTFNNQVTVENPFNPGVYIAHSPPSPGTISSIRSYKQNSIANSSGSTGHPAQTAQKCDGLNTSPTLNLDRDLYCSQTKDSISLKGFENDRLKRETANLERNSTQDVNLWPEIPRKWTLSTPTEDNWDNFPSFDLGGKPRRFIREKKKTDALDVGPAVQNSSHIKGFYDHNYMVHDNVNGQPHNPRVAKDTRREETPCLPLGGKTKGFMDSNGLAFTPNAPGDLVQPGTLSRDRFTSPTQIQRTTQHAASEIFDIRPDDGSIPCALVTHHVDGNHGIISKAPRMISIDPDFTSTFKKVSSHSYPQGRPSDTSVAQFTEHQQPYQGRKQVSPTDKSSAYNFLNRVRSFKGRKTPNLLKAPSFPRVSSNIPPFTAFTSPSSTPDPIVKGDFASNGAPKMYENLETESNVSIDQRALSPDGTVAFSLLSRPELEAGRSVSPHENKGVRRQQPFLSLRIGPYPDLAGVEYDSAGHVRHVPAREDSHQSPSSLQDEHQMEANSSGYASDESPGRPSRFEERLELDGVALYSEDDGTGVKDRSLFKRLRISCSSKSRRSRQGIQRAHDVDANGTTVTVTEFDVTEKIERTKSGCRNRMGLWWRKLKVQFRKERRQDQA